MRVGRDPVCRVLEVFGRPWNEPFSSDGQGSVGLAKATSIRKEGQPSASSSPSALTTCRRDSTDTRRPNSQQASSVADATRAQPDELPWRSDTGGHVRERVPPSPRICSAKQSASARVRRRCTPCEAPATVRPTVGERTVPQTGGDGDAPPDAGDALASSAIKIMTWLEG